MSARKVRLELTPAQVRLVNASLAQKEADDNSDDDDYRREVMDRTRRAVWAAMDAGGVEP